jgi:Domain of unknown function (DUF4440)
MCNLTFKDAPFHTLPSFNPKKTHLLMQLAGGGHEAKNGRAGDAVTSQIIGLPRASLECERAKAQTCWRRSGFGRTLELSSYVDKDRAAIEALIADDFRFTGPFDNRIDRATYFARYWPNSETLAEFNFIHIMPDGDLVFVTYEGRSTSGKRFRNTENLTNRKQWLL